ncbi:hypothetical protein AXF42_Ash018413 [Apostasia shenzhenica]|uniref:Embryonic stem cell-specific 5-hydroxymethylcytosine-binding protein n=1 Tax=Apostasia shenzhenica TaxID=1088818 RepID=A0A2I0BE93_9ASPA|nr:hypothetical protein AXF42_Ash018413 [Apostasia shenzhenica]
MCGRARCTLNAVQVGRACGLSGGDAESVHTVQMDRFRPSYNVSPGAYLPVLTIGSEGQKPEGGEPRPVVHCMKWGLVPSFTKKTEKPDHFRMFNARSESVKEKASFRRLIPNNRCLVAVEGFYEWKKDGSRKQPYYIHFKDQRPLVFAALFDSWANSEGEIFFTFTILTTRSSSALEWLHDRMPVIFGSKNSMDVWLSYSAVKLETILTSYEDSDLIWYPVTTAMGKTSFDGPECIKEIQLKPAAGNQISKMFSKKIGDNHKPDYAFPKPAKPGDSDDKPAKISEGFSPPKEEQEESQREVDLEAKADVPEINSWQMKKPATENQVSKMISKKIDDKYKSDEPAKRSDAFSSSKKKEQESQVIKKELEEEEEEDDLDVKSEVSYIDKSPVKKPRVGDKQTSIFSYFGRK